MLLSTLRYLVYLILAALASALSLSKRFRNWFARVPSRSLPLNASRALVSPADGKITEITQYRPMFQNPNDEEKYPVFTSITIYIGLRDAHIQYYPTSGTITKKVYSPPSAPFRNFPVLFRDKKTQHNESLITYLDTRYGPITVTQIAGVFANKIITNDRVGARVNQGDILGKILLGSTVILTFPETYLKKLNVKRGDHVYGKQTIIASESH